MRQYKSLILKVIIGLLLIGIIIFIAFKLFTGNKKETTNEPIDYFAGLNFEDLSENKEIGKTEYIDNVSSNIKYSVKYPVIGSEKIDKEIKKIVDDLINNYEKDNLTNSKTVNRYYFLDYDVYVSCDNLISLVLKETSLNKSKVLSETSYSYVFNVESKKQLSKDDIFKAGYETVIAKYLKDDFVKGYYFVIRNDKLVVNGNVEIPFKEMNDHLKIKVDSKKSYSNDIKEVSYKDVFKKYVAKEKINVYKKNDLSSDVLISIDKDKNFVVYKDGEDDFSLILYDNVVGYVESSKIKEYKETVKVESSSTSSSTEVKEEIYDTPVTVYATTDVNIREGASSKTKKLGVLVTGDSIEKVGIKGTWAKVKYNDGFAYIANGALSKTKPKSWTDIKDVAPQGEIDPTKPMVALTFDDGPNNTSTVRILNTLEKYNVKATFFDQGKNMIKYPEVVKREASLGEVGMHTYSHSNLNKLSEEQLKREIELSKETYFKVLGYEAKLIRAPYGNSNSKVLKNVDLPFIYWTIDTLDWQSQNVNSIMKKVSGKNLDGKIILMHSIHDASAKATEVMVPYLIDSGYQLVTVSELAQYRGYSLQGGKIYYSFY